MPFKFSRCLFKYEAAVSVQEHEHNPFRKSVPFSCWPGARYNWNSAPFSPAGPEARKLITWFEGLHFRERGMVFELRSFFAGFSKYDKIF